MLLQRPVSIVSRILALMFISSLLAPQPGVARSEPVDNARLRRFQKTAELLAKHLGLSEAIKVAVVPRNDLVISVELLPKSRGYGIAIDRGFFECLADTELDAALAHELGHVWIFTHHPFLQTEALANEIAMKAVSRVQLEALYARLWGYTGVPGDIEELLGKAPAVPAVVTR
jgi:hypothetical protein